MIGKLRVATLGIHHETNTFASNKTTLAEFNRSGLQTYAVQRGQQYADMHGQAQTSMAGYMQGAIQHGFELVPLLFAATDPAGTISSRQQQHRRERTRIKPRLAWTPRYPRRIGRLAPPLEPGPRAQTPARDPSQAPGF